MDTKSIFLALAAALLAACGGGSGDAPPVNVPPVLGAIADRSIEANKASAPIAFTVNDENPDQLSLDATSDTPAVVGEDGLALGGNGRNRSLVVTPVADTLGEAVISIRATDTAGSSAERRFRVAIDPESRSIQQFTRSSFDADADGEPTPINAVEFVDDADADDFADLLAE